MCGQQDKPKRQGGRAARLASRNSIHDLIEKGTQNYTLPPAPYRVCVIACGALAQDILRVIEVNHLDHISMTCLPAKLHSRPERITDAVATAITEARVAGFDHIFIGYGDCGTGGTLDALLKRENVERLPGAHCYAFYSGVGDFLAQGEKDMRSFYLTDFLARHFDALTWRGLGLDRYPELLPDYFGHYERVVYLSQSSSALYMEAARAIATRLELEFEHRPVGYGDLETTLNRL